MPKIVQFRDNCIGCNSCKEHAPDYWEMNEADGKMTLKDSKNKNGVLVREIFDLEIEKNLEAARDCPVGIIRILTDDGKEMK